MSDLLQFVDWFELSFKEQEFVKLVLSKPISKSSSLKKVTIRTVLIKESLLFHFVFTHKDKDISKNFDLKEAKEILLEKLDKEFLIADLFTTKNNFRLLKSKKGSTKLIKDKPTFKTELPKEHNREKKNWLENPALTFELGLGNKEGVISKSGQKKFKQINKFVEIIDSILKNKSEKDIFKVIDMGCGKGYLTFALYDYLKNTANTNTEIVGVELRTPLVEKANEVAGKLNFDGLQFIAKDIAEVEVDNLNLLMALHACDIATDLAIAKGIKAVADFIIVAPCCHKQVRNSMETNDILQPILKHGILLERQAELLTDGLRSLILEYFGYKTKVFQFIETEHTPKNVLIVGEKRKDKQEKALAEFNALKKQFGLTEHYLERLLDLG